MERPIENSGINHIVSLPDEPTLVVALENKLLEYYKRLDLMTINGRPSLEVYLNSCSFYKHYILNSVFEVGKEGINPDDLYFKMKKKYGEIDSELFQEAFNVIEDYIKTDGKNVKNGKLHYNPFGIFN